MKENLLGLKLLESCESVEDTIDEIFRNTLVEDKLVRTNIDGDVIEFILHEGNIYERNNRNNENANAFYMELMTLIKKIYIINGVLHGYAIEYVDKNLFDDETLEKLKALLTLEFDELSNFCRIQNDYSDAIVMKFRKTTKNRKYQSCDIEVDYNEQIYKYIEKFNYNCLGIICTKDLINAKRDLNIIYLNTKE